MAKSEQQRLDESWDLPEEAFDEAFNREELRIVIAERRLERLEAAVGRIERTLARLVQPEDAPAWDPTTSEIEVRYTPRDEVIEGDYLVEELDLTARER